MCVIWCVYFLFNQALAFAHHSHSHGFLHSINHHSSLDQAVAAVEPESPQHLPSNTTEPCSLCLLGRLLDHFSLPDLALFEFASAKLHYFSGSILSFKAQSPRTFLARAPPFYA